MESKTSIYPMVAPEIEEFLANNHVSISELLREEGVVLEESTASDPSKPGSKDAVTVLLASAAVVGTLMPIISRVLEAITHRPIRATELVPVVATDGAGNELKNADGSAQVKWVEKTQLLQPREATGETRIKTEFIGFKFEYEAKSKG